MEDLSRVVQALARLLPPPFTIVKGEGTRRGSKSS
jgi:hypothetical protein